VLKRTVWVSFTKNWAELSLQKCKLTLKAPLESPEPSTPENTLYEALPILIFSGETDHFGWSQSLNKKRKVGGLSPFVDMVLSIDWRLTVNRMLRLAKPHDYCSVLLS